MSESLLDTTEYTKEELVIHVITCITLLDDLKDDLTLLERHGLIRFAIQLQKMADNPYSD